MGDVNAELLRNILARNAATSASQPQNPWDAPAAPGMPPAPAPMPSPTPPPAAAMGPIEDPLAQAQEQMRKRQLLMQTLGGGEGGPMGLEGGDAVIVDVSNGYDTKESVN